MSDLVQAVQQWARGRRASVKDQELSKAGKSLETKSLDPAKTQKTDALTGKTKIASGQKIPPQKTDEGKSLQDPKTVLSASAPKAEASRTVLSSKPEPATRISPEAPDFQAKLVELQKKFEEMVDLALDDGPRRAAASTVVAFLGSPVIIRQGAIKVEVE